MNKWTYERLLTYRPLFEANILSGWTGTGRKNQCRHVVLNELPSKENSFVLLDWSEDILSLLEEALNEPHCTGILILTTSSLDIPTSIMDLAMQMNKPIFLLSNTQGEKIYKRVREIFYLLEHQLEHFIDGDLTTYWIKLLNHYGMDRVMERFNLFLGQEPILLTSHKTFVPFLSNTYTAHDFMGLKEDESARKEEKQLYSIVQNEKAAFYSFPIPHRDEPVIGYLLVEGNHHLDELSLYLIQTIEPVLHSWLKQQEAADQIHLYYKDQFLFDILHNNITTESELVELGQLRKMEFTPNAFVLSMNIDSHQAITNEIITNVQQLLEENRVTKTHVYTAFLNHQIVAIVCPPRGSTEISKNEWDQWLCNILQMIHEKYPDLQVTIGVGRTYESNLNLYKSYHEAKIALQMESNGQDSSWVIHYEDLGFVRLLSYIHNDLLKDFAQQYLAKLEHYDEQNDTEFLRTLAVYCANHGHVPRSAEELYIHPNTLRQRMKKIEGLLEMDLGHYTNLVNIVLALQIYQDATIY